MTTPTQPTDPDANRDRLTRLEVEIGHNVTRAELKDTEIRLMKWGIGVALTLFGLSIGIWIASYFHLLSAVSPAAGG